MVKKEPDPTDQHVGKRVRARRTEMGISQEKLAEGLGITFQQVQKYEKASNRIGMSRLQQIANLLKVPVTYFFNGAPNVKSSSASLPEQMSPALVTEFIGSAEGQALARSFVLIKNPKVRRHIAVLVEQLANDGEEIVAADNRKTARRK